MRAIVPVVLALSLSLPSAAAAAGRRPASPGLPPAEGDALAALARSPRHGEFADIPLAGGGSLRAFVAYPERSGKAGVVIVIHEIYGLTDWIRGVADRLAADGFIAVAPDLLSGLAPGGGGTEALADRDEAVKLVRGLSAAAVRERLDAARAYAVRLPAANGRVAVLGFCWGGSQSFAYAAAEPPPDAAVVYYGATPDSAALRRVRAPVLGHYGGDDARVTATVPAARAALRGSFEPHVHPGAGHGFLRQQDGRDGANLRATRASWPRTVEFLRRRLR